jgi:hypothetical protein
MHDFPEIQFQISLLNIVSAGEDQSRTRELENLLLQQEPSEKR